MAAIFKDEIEVVDKHGFTHKIVIEHHPDVGTSIAYRNGLRVSQFEYGIFRPPLTDDDAEWESFSERFYEGMGDAAIEQLRLECVQQLNKVANIE